MFFHLVILVAATMTAAQQLQVDSVSVDSVWNSDSSWTDGQGVAQQRYSRDIFLSFIPMGGGMAQCFVEMSVDSGRTWAQPVDSLTALDSGIVADSLGVHDSGTVADSLSVLDSGIASLVQCGVKSRVKLRMLGQDRPNVAFQIIARQWQPILAGNPEQVTLGVTAPLTPGAFCSVHLQCTLKNASQGLGFTTISMTWWDAFGNGTWNDSTPTPAYTWLTAAPQGPAGQQRAMIVKARDANGLWSAPCTLSVQFGMTTRLLTLVSLPAGTFQMGSANIGFSASPVHSVTLGAFTISQTLVTQAQYQAVMDTNPSLFQDDALSTLQPVEQVSWYDAALFCNALSKQTGKDTVYSYTGALDSSVTIDYSKNGYRLPTEAEYEYACRAGTTTDYSWGRNYPPTTIADTLTIDSNAVWYHNSPDMPQPVATRRPNAWGLYDMSGNVWEWCGDWYGGYSAASQTDPTGPTSGSGRVLRGGSFYDEEVADDLCSAYRVNNDPLDRYAIYGFRVVCGPR